MKSKLVQTIVSCACVLCFGAVVSSTSAYAATAQKAEASATAKKAASTTATKSNAKSSSSNKSSAKKNTSNSGSKKAASSNKSSAKKNASNSGSKKAASSNKGSAKKNAANSSSKKTASSNKSTDKKNTANSSSKKAAATAAVATAAVATAATTESSAQAAESEKVDAQTMEAAMREAAKKYSLDFFDPVQKSRVTAMREAYIQAENAFKRGDEALGLKIQREKLQGYPLNLWLNYYYLAYNLRPEKFEPAMKFIESREHGELADMLKDRYARYFSERRDYKRLSRLIGEKPFDENALSELSFQQKSQMCRFYEANWPLNKVNEDAIRFATRVYLDLKKRPNTCSGLMTLFDAKGYLTDKLMMKRYEDAYILRAYKDTTESLAEQLAKTSFAERVKAQMELYEDPSKLFEKVEGNGDTEHRVAVLAFSRYANMEPSSARNDLKKFIKKYDPSDAELVDIYRIFSLSFLGRRYSLADVQWVDKNLPEVAWTDELKEMRLRRAIYFAQWNNVYVLIDKLPKDVQQEINWRYWKGRSAYELGKTDEADLILGAVAQDRSFFGFYAAQTLKKDYAFNYVKLDDNYSFPMDVAHNKSAVRFLELIALDDDNAIYEWREIAKRSPEREGMIMAQWALQTGNVKYAIDYVVSSKRWDALDYRFPIAYKEYYQHAAKQSGVELSFLYGISRQESMLNHEIKSWAGAVGLMQLMPGTARDIAKKEKWEYEGVKSLIDPETNIKYGSTYLQWMLNRYDNNRLLAAAAYNAGPGRIPQWRSKDGIYRDAAMYVETIPFEETRKYVQNVLLYDAIYDYLLTGKKGQLMRPHELTYVY